MLHFAGADVLRELDAQDRAGSHARQTFVDRLRSADPPDLVEVDRIRYADRRP